MECPAVRCEAEQADGAAFVDRESGSGGNAEVLAPALAVCTTGYGGLPAAPPDPRFATVTELTTAGVSNYNGLTLSFNRRVTSGLLVTANYTYGHAMDMVSNGGITLFDNITNTSILAALRPSNLWANYRNADYDVRQSIVAGYVWNTPRIAGSRVLNAALGGWMVSGNVYARSGLPYSVIDSAQAAVGAKYNYKGPILANFLGGPQSGCGINATCLNGSEFSSPSAEPGAQERNQFRGLPFFDTDLSLTRQF